MMVDNIPIYYMVEWQNNGTSAIIKVSNIATFVKFTFQNLHNEAPLNLYSSPNIAGWSNQRGCEGQGL